MDSLQTISAMQILETLNTEDRIKLFVEFFKKNPYEYAIINEESMSKKDCWNPLGKSLISRC
jgi:hypothetical protein